MSNNIELLNISLDRQEQHSRRKCLLIHGLPEKRYEDTDQLVVETIQEKMGEKITIEEMDRTHRQGPQKKENNKNRPVIVNFLGTTHKTKYLKIKKN